MIESATTLLHKRFKPGKKKTSPYFENEGLAQLVRCAYMGSSLESFGVRPSVRMAGGLPPLPSTNVGKYCWVSRGSFHLKKKKSLSGQLRIIDFFLYCA